MFDTLMLENVTIMKNVIIGNFNTLDFTNKTQAGSIKFINQLGETILESNRENGPVLTYKNLTYIKNNAEEPFVFNEKESMYYVTLAQYEYLIQNITQHGDEFVLSYPHQTAFVQIPKVMFELMFKDYFVPRKNVFAKPSIDVTDSFKDTNVSFVQLYVNDIFSNYNTLLNSVQQKKNVASMIPHYLRVLNENCPEKIPVILMGRLYDNYNLVKKLKYEILDLKCVDFPNLPPPADVAAGLAANAANAAPAAPPPAPGLVIRNPLQLPTRARVVTPVGTPGGGGGRGKTLRQYKKRNKRKINKSLRATKNKREMETETETYSNPQQSGGGIELNKDFIKFCMIDTSDSQASNIAKKKIYIATKFDMAKIQELIQNGGLWPILSGIQYVGSSIKSFIMESSDPKNASKTKKDKKSEDFEKIKKNKQLLALLFREITGIGFMIDTETAKPGRSHVVNKEPGGITSWLSRGKPEDKFNDAITKYETALTQQPPPITQQFIIELRGYYDAAKEQLSNYTNVEQKKADTARLLPLKTQIETFYKESIAVPPVAAVAAPPGPPTFYDIVHSNISSDNQIFESPKCQLSWINVNDIYSDTAFLKAWFNLIRNKAGPGTNWTRSLIPSAGLILVGAAGIVLTGGVAVGAAAWFGITAAAAAATASAAISGYGSYAAGSALLPVVAQTIIDGFASNMSDETIIGNILKESIFYLVTEIRYIDVEPEFFDVNPCISFARYINYATTKGAKTVMDNRPDDEKYDKNIHIQLFSDKKTAVTETTKFSTDKLGSGYTGIRLNDIDRTFMRHKLNISTPPDIKKKLTNFNLPLQSFYYALSVTNSTYNPETGTMLQDYNKDKAEFTKKYKKKLEG
jgi:hypothetical protein